MPSNGFLFEPIPHASHRLWSVQFNTFLRIANDFEQWLDANRSANVSEVFHDIVARVAELEAALKVARDALNTCTHEGFCDYDDATEALAKINEVMK